MVASAAAAAGRALEVSHLTYKPVSASRTLLNDVSFALTQGRIGLIYGPSGSGKSTLLNVLAGFATPYDGQIASASSAEGASGGTRQLGQWEQGKGGRGVGVVFQFPERYFVGNTIIEELSFGWRHSNSLEVRSEFVQRLQPVLETTGLTHLSLDRRLSELSGGYQVNERT